MVTGKTNLRISTATKVGVLNSTFSRLEAAFTQVLEVAFTRVLTGAFMPAQAVGCTQVLAAEWHATDWWRLVATYSWLRLELNNSAASVFAEGKDPQQQASLRSSMNLPGNLEFDLWGRFVDRLPSFGIAASLDLDARLAWKASKNVEIRHPGGRCARTALRPRQP